jgi:hypothetical protein
VITSGDKTDTYSFSYETPAKDTDKMNKYLYNAIVEEYKKMENTLKSIQ